MWVTILSYIAFVFAPIPNVLVKSHQKDFKKDMGSLAHVSSTINKEIC
jgi:hypothetical protein